MNDFLYIKDCVVKMGLPGQAYTRPSNLFLDGFGRSLFLILCLLT